MRKIFLIILISVIHSSLTVADDFRLDPRLFLLNEFSKRNEALSKTDPSLRKHSGQWYVQAFITTSGDREEIEYAGGKVICSMGGIMLTEIPVYNLECIASLANVQYVESVHFSRLYLNVSVAEIGVKKVREQLGLTGKGVILGMIDSGIDWLHEDFRSPDGKTRIKYLLDLSQAGSVYGGMLYTKDDIDRAIEYHFGVEQYDYSGHGTHVAGIAAGDGSSDRTFGSYSGVAPEADLVVVKATKDVLGTQISNADQLKGLVFVDSVAAVMNRPYIVNMSFGGHFGAHDGSSPIERAIDNLIGLGKPGKAVVSVAGNDREEAIRAAANPGRDDDEITFIVPDYVPNVGSGNNKVQIDAWYSGLKKLSVTLFSPGGQKFGPVTIGKFLEKKSNEGYIYIWNGLYQDGEYGIPGSNPFNGDNEIYIEINDAAGNARPRYGTWILRFSGEDTQVDAWLFNSSMDAFFEKGAVNDTKIAIPGTAHNIITVGAYTSKENWYDLDGHYLTIDLEGDIQIGGISSFSNPGPTRARGGDSGTIRVKPEITAPGQIIGSSYSEKAAPNTPASIFKLKNTDYPNGFILQDQRHAMAQGTSMAAPHVSGVIALILQKYPNATAIQIRDILQKSAEPVSGGESNYWGWGKLDALTSVHLDPEIEPPLGYKLYDAYPNPFSLRTKIAFDIPIKSQGYMKTTVNIFNILGQEVRTISLGNMYPGKHEVFWDGRDQYGYRLANGVYIIQLKAGDHTDHMKISYLNSRR